MRCRPSWPCRASPLMREAPLSSLVSDGLERGESDAMRAAVVQLARRACRVSWITPLATDPRYRPETEALIAIQRLHRRSRGRRIHCTDLPRIFLSLGTKESRMTDIVDGHLHIWQQADLLWLIGPMQPRIFGPYEPIRRDYPVQEYLDDLKPAPASPKRFTSRPTGPNDHLEDEAAYV